MLGRDQWLRPSVFEGAECRLVGERIAGEFAKVPIELGTEAKDEDCGEPRYGNRPVVPEELRTVEDAAEEVAAGDYVCRKPICTLRSLTIFSLTDF